ncbi:uncharacterized protein A4U43_UnF820 [Asparagus officinalis]|uniref:Kinesin motor domain-containing protein n=2 Tax=Asparagus officinalis TaxID=4686 RepID=A0A1R3L7N1_ASPOF|nr:uncharacterized protein A4U43_UnF820 [Asparagus officinalis]
MMYGPTGSGKSYTMFGGMKEPGIVYRALKDMLRAEGDDEGGFGLGFFVKVTVLEIYNEEIYDLLSGNSNGIGIPKGSQTPKVKLEVMSKKAKNASYISGNEAGKISREVAKVEKRRIVKSTNCNERSSRSHCLIILDVPSVGGRLMLVDMAGSENIEQAGQTGFEAKIQTGKINQGNTALKRVVESIANGDSHVPFRDSKLTMLLQDSFEDDKSKILMILCASPDPKEMHKTISTLEYGAKAKCIVRAAHVSTPKEKAMPDESSTLLRSRIAAMNQFIYKLQMENRLREKERDDAQKEVAKKEEEILAVKSKLKVIEAKVSSLKEEEIESKVEERTQMMRIELTRMEEKMLRQQEELNSLRQQLEKIELERGNANEEALKDIDGGKFMKKLSEIYGGDQGMEKSMELDMGDLPVTHDVMEIKENFHQLNPQYLGVEDEEDINAMRFPDRVCLSTVFERDDEGDDRDSTENYEVDKEVIEENTPMLIHNGDNSKEARKTRIQNIFRLCGNYRELSQQVKVRTPTKTNENENARASPLGLKESPISSLLAPLSSLHIADENKCVSHSETIENLKENSEPDGMMEVCVKWEASKEFGGKIIKKMKVVKDTTLSDLRKLIEVHLEEDKNKQAFTFLLLGDPTGAPVTKEKEATVPVCKLPICNNLSSTHLACLRPIKKSANRPNHAPFTSLENTLPIAGHV